MGLGLNNIFNLYYYYIMGECKCKELIKNVVIRGSVNGLNGVMTRYINIPFVPDKVIVKYSYYYQDGNQDGYIFSDLITPNDQVLCPLIDGGQLQLNTQFPLNKPISNTFRFEFRDFDDTIQTGLTGNILLHLEFSKHEK